MERSTMEDLELLSTLSDRSYTHYEHENGRVSQERSSSRSMIKTAYKLQRINDTFVYRILQDEEVIGGVIVAKVGDSAMHVRSLFVHPEHQNKGVGRQVMKTLEEMHPGKLWMLETPKWAERNIHFYQKLGYNITGTFTSTSEDMYTFEKDLRTDRLKE